MNKIGLDVESLINRGVAEHAATSGELTVEVFEDKELINNPKLLQASLVVAREEAIIRAVAKMIEENNNELLKQLKAAGVLPDQ
ncbi:hypothetical protein [Paenibacillus thiaminolyticus]|uniref:hypothetical protein n=1 Tax=Paenibacillus thiaminolyticus TaxID=49283 RepID=UPI001602FA43|nr:hypothetical protein [Paenibacillus thiaminolyticus]